MKIISMVPSWTETLLMAGAPVVGRTRFCIHPSDLVRGVPAVGGTKDIKWEKVRELSPDLLLLDREENPKIMNDEAPCPALATHITSVHDVAPELERIARALVPAGDEVCARLFAMARRWRTVSEAPVLARPPEVMEWIGGVGSLEGAKGVSEVIAAGSGSLKVVYVIWRDPWMAVAPGTFIASVLERLGFEVVTPALSSPLGMPVRSVVESASSRYPEFRMEDVPSDVVLLFSSEPYPFHRKKDELRALPHRCALVDGESFSWFGWRSLLFLERFLLRDTAR